MEKSVKNWIYRQYIGYKKRYIKDTSGCVEIPKIQTKIIEDWVQNSDINFKQSFKFSKLWKVQTEISIKKFKQNLTDFQREK